MESDRESIGLTAETQSILAELEERGWFPEGQDAARFAWRTPFAPKSSKEPLPEPKRDGLPGTLTGRAKFRALLAALYPGCETPVRLMEHLVNEGLRMISARVRLPSTGPAETNGLSNYAIG